MCGIFFFCDTNIDDYRLVLDNIYEITDSLQKRGPDHFLINKSRSNATHWIGINTVLSIRTSKKNLSPSLVKANKDGFFAYNGETYEPDTQSVDDTDLFNNLISKETNFYEKDHYQGYFAYSKVKDDSLFFSVDFISEKPLFYWQYKNKFCISSDLTSILILKKYLSFKNKLNKNKLKEYFLTRHLIQFNKTIYEDIYRCLPGSKYVYNLSSHKLFSKNVIQNITDAREHLNIMLPDNQRDLLEITISYIKNSISDLRNRDDVGYIISGGVDSTLISLIAAEYFQNKVLDKMNFLTLTFGDKDIPAKMAKDIVSEISNKHQIINVSEKEYMNHLNFLYKNLSIPMPTHSFASFSVLCEKAVGNNFRILVGGEGADEIYNGYSLYRNIIQENMPNSGSLSPYSSLNDKYKLFGNDIKNLENESDLYQAFEAIKDDKDNWNNKIEKSLFLDAFIQCPSTGLFCVDQVGGIWGIESRSPLANPNAIAWRFLNFPYNSEQKFFNDKRILRDELSKLSKVWAKKTPAKQGFSGYPNEIFNNNDLVKSAQEISAILEIDYESIKGNFGKKDFDWKILNLGNFINLNSSKINL